MDLSRFGVRYSHSGVSLKTGDNAPWSVRQLYYACDEERPRLYDQGLAGFVFGTEIDNRPLPDCHPKPRLPKYMCDSAR